MNSGFEGSDCGFQLFPLHQHIVCVESRHRKNWDARIRQGLQKRRENPRHRKRKRTLKFQAYPTSLDANVARDAALFANDGKLFGSLRNAEEPGAERPFRDRTSRRQLANGQLIRKHAIFQMVGQSRKRVLQRPRGE